MATFSTSGVTDREGTATTTSATRAGDNNDGSLTSSRLSVTRPSGDNDGSVVSSRPPGSYVNTEDGLVQDVSERVSEHAGLTPSGVSVNKEQTGVLVPGSYFESATGRVLNINREEITDAEWIIADGPFPIAREVNDARFQMQLLRVVYDNFYLVVDSPEERLDYTFFQSNNVSAEPGNRTNMTIEFEEAFPGSGVDLSPGIR